MSNVGTTLWLRRCNINVAATLCISCTTLRPHHNVVITLCVCLGLPHNYQLRTFHEKIVFRSWDIKHRVYGGIAYTTRVTAIPYRSWPELFWEIASFTSTELSKENVYGGLHFSQREMYDFRICSLLECNNRSSNWNSNSEFLQ